MKKYKLSKVWRLAFVSIVLVYILVVGVFITFLVKIPKDYSSVQKEQRITVKIELEKAIDNNNKDALKELEEKYAIEFVVMDTSKKVVYSTVPITENFEFKNTLSKQAVSSEEYFQYHNDNDIYTVWLLQYYLSPQKTFDKWSFSLFGAVAVLVTLNFIVVVVLFTKFIRPLERLDDNVKKISKYQLDLINTNNINEYDQISQQLVHFAKNLEDYIDNSVIEYTTLEKNLQIQNEKLDYKNKQVAALTHDLKGPINIINMQTNNLLNNNNEDTKSVIVDINKSSRELINEINDISYIIYKDNYVAELKEINLTEEILDTLDTYNVKLNEKNLDIDIDVDSDIRFKTNPFSIKQIINNAISNICSYTPDNGRVVIECYKENNKIKMNFYNDSRQFTKEELDNIFKLFFRYSEDTVGTGTGLYTIKRLVEELNGEVGFVNKEVGVELQIEIEVETL